MNQTLKRLPGNPDEDLFPDLRGVCRRYLLFFPSALYLGGPGDPAAADLLPHHQAAAAAEGHPLHRRPEPQY